MHEGLFGENATYLPGRRMPGIRIGENATDIHLTAAYGSPVGPTAQRARRGGRRDPWAGKHHRGRRRPARYRPPHRHHAARRRCRTRATGSPTTSDRARYECRRAARHHPDADIGGRQARTGADFVIGATEAVEVAPTPGGAGAGAWGCRCGGCRCGGWLNLGRGGRGRDAALPGTRDRDRGRGRRCHGGWCADGGGVADHRRGRDGLDEVKTSVAVVMVVASSAAIPPRSPRSGSTGDGGSASGVDQRKTSAPGLSARGQSDG